MSRGQHRLTNSAASAEAFLREAGKRGYVLRTIVHELIGLLDLYGAERLEQALVEALARDVPHPNAVRLTLQRIQEETNQPPPLAVALPDDSRVKSLTVKPHKLSDYDQLNFDHKDHHHDER